MSEEKVADAEAPAPKKKGKMLIIVIGAVLLLAIGGAGGWFFMQSSAKDKGADGEHAAAADDHAEQEDDQPIRPRTKKKGEAPIFVDLEPFVINLADVEQDRFAQIGVTLEVVDAEVTAEMKQVEPAVVNAILVLLSSKTSKEILSVEGKMKLANQIADFANAIMAGESLPHLKSFDTHDKDGAKKGHSARDDESNRRAKYIPQRVLNTHFKQFIIQ